MGDKLTRIALVNADKCKPRKCKYVTTRALGNSQTEF